MQGIIAPNVSMTDIPAAPQLIEPLQTFMLDVGDGHTIYVEELGNPNGQPLVTFHGGPGSFTKPKHRARYDLDKFRVIMFDQRGGGLSRPLAVDDRASLAGFSPATIIADAECIRQYLGIDSWHVTGVSWGSTMALLYAITYPTVTRSVTLRALFMAQTDNWAWAADGAQQFAPLAYEQATSLIPGLTGLALMTALADRILTGSVAEGVTATNTMLDMELGMELLTPPVDPNAVPKSPMTDTELLNIGLLYAQIIKHHALPIGWGVTEQAQAALAGKPFVIVHGACDLGFPVRYVYELKRAHPHAQLHIAQNAGHGVDLNGTGDIMYKAVLANL